MAARSPSAGGCPRHVFSWKIGEELGSSQVTEACLKLCSYPTYLLLSKSRPTAQPNPSGSRRHAQPLPRETLQRPMAKDWVCGSSAEKEGRIGNSKSSCHVPMFPVCPNCPHPMSPSFPLSSCVFHPLVKERAPLILVSSHAASQSGFLHVLPVHSGFSPMSPAPCPCLSFSYVILSSC